MNTLKITRSTCPVCSSNHLLTVPTAISAARRFGKWNTPVEMQQKATLRSKFERIGVNEAYSSARTLGTECATLYVEKMLTDYVRLKKGTNNSYFYYDAYANKIPVVVPYEDGVKESFQKL